MRRRDFARSRRIWSSRPGRLMSDAKMNTETAIDSDVRIVRRLLRVRFRNTSERYFMARSDHIAPRRGIWKERGVGTYFNLKPTVGFKLPSAGVTPAPGIRRIAKRVDALLLRGLG